MVRIIFLFKFTNVSSFYGVFVKRNVYLQIVCVCAFMYNVRQEKDISETLWRLILQHSEKKNKREFQKMYLCEDIW